MVASARLGRFLPRSARLPRRFVNGETLNCSQGAKRGPEGDPGSPRAIWKHLRLAQLPERKCIVAVERDRSFQFNPRKGQSVLKPPQHPHGKPRHRAMSVELHC